MCRSGREIRNVRCSLNCISHASFYNNNKVVDQTTRNVSRARYIDIVVCVSLNRRRIEVMQYFKLFRHNVLYQPVLLQHSRSSEQE